MTKKELKERTDAAVGETASALQTVYDSLNQGQQKKLLKDDAVAELLARYEVRL